MKQRGGPGLGQGRKKGVRYTDNVQVWVTIEREVAEYLKKHARSMKTSFSKLCNRILREQLTLCPQRLECMDNGLECTGVNHEWCDIKQTMEASK